MLASARFYEERATGLGIDFLAAVEETSGESSSSRKRAPSNAAASASGLSWAFPSLYFTKTSLTESSSPPSCISTEGQPIGSIGCAIEERRLQSHRYTAPLVLYTVDSKGNVIGFSVLRVSSLKKTHPGGCAPLIQSRAAHFTFSCASPGGYILR